MDKLLDVVPAHLRFSYAPGASSVTRNVLLKNISVAELHVEVVMPKPPFRISRGAERLSPGPLRLAVDETLPLQVSCDCTAPPKEPGGMCCEFMTLKVELCSPLHVDLLALPEGSSEEDAKRLIQARLRELGGGGTTLGASATGAALDSAVSGGGGAPAASASASTSASASAPDLRPDAEVSAQAAALAAFLGEAPSTAALRGQRGTAPLSLVAWRHDAGGIETPPESPGRAPTKGAFGEEDDDRPPTPTPEGFDAPRRSLEDAPPRKAEDAAPPWKAAALSTGGSSRSALVTAGAAVVAGTAFGTAGLPYPSPEATQRPPVAPRELRRSAPGGRSDLFYIEGLGWCDDFGRVVAADAIDGAGGYTGSAELSAATSTRRPPVAPGAMSATATSAGSMSATAATATRGRSKPRGRSRPPSEQPCAEVKAAPAKRLTSRERKANWDALGGI